MTSTTLQAKRGQNFSSVLLWTIKRHKTPMIIFTTLVFCFSSVFFIFNRSIVSRDNLEYYNDENYEIQQLLSSIINNNILITVVTMLFTLFIGITVFGYLHNKRTLDTFASLPLTRRTMFCSRFFAGLIIILAPITLITLANVLIFAGVPKAIELLLLCYVIMLVCVLASYSLTVFMAVCCGTSIDTGISTIFVVGATPVLIVLISSILNICTPGISGNGIFDGMNLPFLGIFCLSPFFLFFSPLTSIHVHQPSGEEIIYYESSIFGAGTSIETTRTDITEVFYEYDWASVWGVVIYAVIFAAVFFALGYILSKKRKTESAQAGFAYRLPIHFIRLIICILAALIVAAFVLSAVFYRGTPNTLAVYAIAAVSCAVSAFIVHMIITLVFNRGFKGFIKSLRAYGVTIGALLVIGLCLSTGGFGRGSTVPALEDIKSVSLTSGYYNMYSPRIIEETENKELVLKLHQSIVDNGIEYPINPIEAISLANGYSEDFDYNDNEYLYDRYPISITYKLNNGSEITRQYSQAYVKKGNAESMLNKLLASDEIKMQNIVYKENIKSDIQGLRLNTATNIYTDIYLDGQTDKYIDALKKDVLADPYYATDEENNKILGRVYIDFLRRESEESYYSMEDIVYVKESYKNFWDLMSTQSKMVPSIIGESIVKQKNYTANDMKNIKTKNETIATVYVRASNIDFYAYNEDTAPQCMLYDKNFVPLAKYDSSLTFTDKIEDDLYEYEVKKVDGVEWAYICFYDPSGSYPYHLFKFTEDMDGKILTLPETEYEERGYSVVVNNADMEMAAYSEIEYPNSEFQIEDGVSLSDYE